MNGGSIINNTAKAGGGVFIKNSLFEKTPAFASYTSGVISGNIVTLDRPETYLTSNLVFFGGWGYDPVRYNASPLDQNTAITTKNFNDPVWQSSRSRAFDVIY